MSDLYSTRTAARLLGVSEASVRRWSDSGQLPVRRIGRRRTRQFAGADLRKFMAGHAQPATDVWTAGSAAAAGPGIEGHDHLATFYDGDAGRMLLSLPFLREGLLAGQACFLVASSELTGAYLEALREEAIDPEAAIAGGSLVARTGVGSSPREAIATWEQLFWQALGSGAGAIRVVGEMATYEGFSEVEDMLDYEIAYDITSKRFPVMTLCQYDVRRFDGSTLLAALKSHPDLFAHRLAQVLL